MTELRRRSALLVLAILGLFAVPPPPAAAQSLSLDEDLWVGPVYFSWYRVNRHGHPQGQYYGPWQPLDGRLSWDGSVGYHRRHIGHIAKAGFNMIFAVDTYKYRQEQENLFQAIRERKDAGKKHPKVAPYLAAGSFECRECTKRLGGDRGQREFYQVVKKWFRRFYEHLGPEDLVTLADGRVMIGVWWIPGAELAPPDFFARMNRRLLRDFGFEGYWTVNFTFEHAGPDEVNHTFATLNGFEHNERGNMDLTVGFWPPEELTAQDFLARDNGNTYTKAWNQAINRVNTCNAEREPFRITVVSYNELTEGSGIFPAVCSKHNQTPNDRHFSGPPRPDRCVDEPCHPHRLHDSWATSCQDPRAPYLYLEISRRKIKQLAKRSAGLCRGSGLQ